MSVPKQRGPGETGGWRGQSQNRINYRNAADKGRASSGGGGGGWQNGGRGPLLGGDCAVVAFGFLTAVLASAAMDAALVWRFVA